MGYQGLNVAIRAAIPMVDRMWRPRQNGDENAENGIG